MKKILPRVRSKWKMVRKWIYINSISLHLDNSQAASKLDIGHRDTEGPAQKF